MTKKKNRNKSISGLPKLPSELFGNILLHLGDDRDALRTCSTVSSEFNKQARNYMFHYMKITADNVKLLLKLLTSPRCTIADAVRILEMELYFDVWDRRADNTMPTICTHLKNVEQLFILRCMWHHDSRAGPAFVNGFKQVKKLRIRDSFFWNSEHLAYVLSSFPLLQNLSLWSCKPMTLWGGPRTRPHAKDPPPLPQEYTVPNSIIDMEVVSCGILYWELLSSSHHLSHIRRLDLACHQKYGDLGHAKTLIATAGAALEDLRLSTVFSSERKYNNILTLENNTNLKSFRVGFPSGLADTDEVEDFLPWMRNVLESITSTRLSHLILEIDEDIDPQVIMTLWPRLGINDVLAREPFRNLTRITVAVTTAPRRRRTVDQSIKESIKRLLQEFDDKGIVNVLLNEEELHYSTISGPPPCPAIIFI